MNKTEFLQGLGLVSPEAKPEEIRVEGKHAKRVAPRKKNLPKNPNPVPEANSTQELDTLNAKVTALEEKHKSNGEAASEQLQSAEDEITELRSNIADLQEQITKAEATTTELRDEKAKAEEELAATKDTLGGLEEKLTALEQANSEKEVLEKRVKELEDWKADKLAEEAVKQKSLIQQWPLNIFLKKN